jgi:uncharacterized membrane protein
MMNKVRLENLTDGVFAVAMTLLVIDVAIPATHGPLAQELLNLVPLFISYFLSFAILSAFWLANNGVNQFFIRNATRELIQITILYLSFICLIPFSTRLLGANPTDQVAVIWYGLNYFAAGTAAGAIFWYGYTSPEIEKGQYTHRMYKQACVRHILMPSFALLGIAATFLWLPLAFVMYLVPVAMNAIPGSLNAAEKIFGFSVGE